MPLYGFASSKHLGWVILLALVKRRLSDPKRIYLIVWPHSTRTHSTRHLHRQGQIQKRKYQLVKMQK
jgi:hypothetical protein